MTAADGAAVARIGYASWLANRYYPEWFEVKVEQRVKAFLEKFVLDPNCDLVVAVKGGLVVGWGARDSLEEPGNKAAAWDYISDLWIDPAHQGQGIGTELLSIMVDRIKSDGLKRARIEVAQANLRAIDLYIRHGFRETWRGVRMSETLGLPLPRILLERII